MNKLARLMAMAAIGVTMFTPSVACADTWTNANGSVWTYALTNDCAMVVSVASEEAELSVPASLGDRPAALVGTGAFADCVALTNVVFSNRYGEIGCWQGAFKSGTSVTMEAEEGYAFSRWVDAEGNGVNLVSFTNDFVSVRAEFAPVVIVTNVSFRQRYPWNGLVDIDCTVECVDPTTNITLSVSARDEATGKSLAVHSIWLESDETHTNALSVTAGTYRLVWDAGRDNPGFVGENVVVAVQGGLVGTGGLYIVIDLSGGPDAAFYPVSYLNDVPQGGWTDEYKTTKLVLRWIPAGTFIMGCETTEVGFTGKEAISHEVTISHPFYMGVFEVTQKQYELVTGGTPSSSQGDARPLERVSWNAFRGNSAIYNWPNSSDVDSSTFMGKLRNRTGIETLDLPTEAKWEYACRAGTTSALNSGKNLTSSSHDLAMDDVGRYEYNQSDGKGGYSSAHTTVGSYLPNAWGLYDMHGNVWEWCLDWYQNRNSFSSAEITDPVGPQSGSERVERGGFWSNGALYCRSASRYEMDPSTQSGYGIGFRLSCGAGMIGGSAVSGRAESMVGCLDLNTGTRIVTEGVSEQIAYSPRWGGTEICVVTVDGISAITNTEEGVAVWIPEGTGRHTLTHTAGDTIYTAQFTVLGEDVETHAGMLTSNEVWSADKVHLVTTAVTVPSGVSLTIEPGAVVKFMSDTGLTVSGGGACIARGAIFTHANDDTVGGDTLCDGEETAAVMGEYTTTGSITDDDSTEYRYMPPQTLTSNISSNTRLRGYRTYIASNSVTVASGATLTLQPGTIIKFANGRSLTVNGTLDAQGTRAAPIVFTSLKDDEHGGDTNGDGDMTYVQAGDWHQITGSGTIKLNYCEVLWCSAQNNQGALYPRGGTWQFDNSIVAHCQYDCMRSYGGTFTANNSVFMDSSMGAAPSSGTARFNNCVFNNLTTAVRWGCGTFYNCIFSDIAQDIIDTKFYSSTLSCRFYNCCFWNPEGTGDHASAKVGHNGCFYADPLFIDAENGDFRIAADSPCVDAGDGRQSPEFDLYGQPRMDVKRVKDTGTPNDDGVCPDIGIYEFPGVPAVPLPDLAVIDVAINALDDNVKPGDAITVTYVVTNRGKAEATGILRDLFRFKGVDAALGGQTVDAAEIGQAYNIAVGASASMATTLTVPTLKAGTWKVGLVVNAERDIYENVMANNASETEGTISIALDSFTAGGSKTVDVASGGVAGATATGFPASGGAIVAALPQGVTFYASVGYVPDEDRHDVAGAVLADGRTALFIPVHEEGETVYVTLVNDSGAAQTVTLEALVSSDGLEVAKPADVAVTAKGPKVTAKLVLPESVRDGRIYAAWVEYSNSGDQDAALPIFTISRTGGGATFSATAKGEYSANPLSLIGLAPSAPRGKLKPGEAGRVEFYFMSSGNLSLKLGMVTEKSTSVLNGFSSVAEYCAGMSAAATRLCARGGADPDFTAVLAQALNEKRGAGGAAVCGTLRNAVTKIPMTGFTIALIATNDLAVVDAVRSDASGAFALSAPEAGAYTVEVQGVQGNETLIYELTDEDVTGVSIFATPYCVVEGVAMIGATVEPVAGAKVIIDDIRTDKFGDFETETGDDGTFRFTSLLDGEYELIAYPPEGWCMATSGVFVVTNGAAYAHNAVFSVRGTKVTGSVTDVETGNAVTNAAVILTLSDAGESISVLTDFEGRFVFNGVGIGTYAVEVADNDFELQSMHTLEVTDDTAEATLPLQVRMKPVFTVMNPIGMVSHTAAFSLIADITSPEWDFDGDGVTDSTEAEPSWTYNAVGNYTVTLAYTDATGVRRRSVAENAVEVIETIENVLKAGNVVLTTGCGVTVESVTTNELVLVGAAAASYEPGMVIGMKEGPQGGFIRKVISVRQDGANRFVFAVEPGDLDDLYDEYFFTTDFGFSEEQVSAMMSKSVRRLMAKSSPGDEHKIPLYVEVTTFKPWKITIGGPSSTVTHYSEPVAGSQTCYKTKKGKKVESYKVKNSYLLKLPVTVAREIWSNEGSNSIKKGKKFINWKGNVKGPGFWGPWGLYFSIQCDYGIEGNVSAEGSVTGEFTLRGVNTVEYRRENGGKEKQKVVDRDFSDPGFRIASIAGTVCAEIDAHVVIGVYVSWLKAIGRVGVGAKIGMTFGLEQDLAYNFPGDFVKNEGLKSTFRLTSSLYGAIEVSAKLLNVTSAKKHGADLPWKLQWKGQLELGDMNFKTSGTGLTVNFESINPKIEAEGFLLGVFNGIEVPAVNQAWSFGDWSFGMGRTTSHTYEQEGNYLVRLGATCTFPSSFISLGNPFAKTFSAKVRVYEDKPPEPQTTEDTGNKNPSKSCDPNEMDGPEGVGEERYVKPGDWMTYTVYFENKADADVPAQEVRVTNPLSEWLDWSTFEMREVAFCNQVETGLAGKQNGTITVDQDDTAYKVQATVSLDDKDGSVEWYLRSMDPARAEYNYWPPDGEGLLPPNDDTHRGEGHLTYRIKVREDAPANVVITNSATIVFDYNDPIETDPAWWNTVGSPAVDFVNNEVEMNESETATIRIKGGNADAASSVKVYLTYNTAAAADVDLAKGQVDGVTPKGGLKFPLTLTWAKDEIGEKVITIPVKADKTVEGDEFFTLQLAEAEGMELGEDRVCTVTIRDATVAAGKETLQDAVNNAIIKMSTSGKGKWAYAAVGTSGEAAPGKTVSASAMSPVLKAGEMSELKAAAVKGSGTLTFDVRVANPNLEGESPEAAEDAAKTVLTLLDGKAELLAWTNETDWTSASYTVEEVKATSHAFTWRVVQGADTNAHAYVANVVWSPAGTDMHALSLAAASYVGGEPCDDPNAGGSVSGGGVYPDKTKISLAATAKVGWEFVGWARGGGRGATALPGDGDGRAGSPLPAVDGEILSNKAKWQVVVTNDAEYVAVFEKIPYVRGLADPADGGKVSGSGLCARGKKVTLKATANKNYTFLGWRQGTGNGELGTGNGEWGTGNGFVATTPSLVIDRSAKPAKDSKTSTTITNVAEDVTYYAVFKSDPKVTVAVEATKDEGAALTGKGAGKYVAGTITGEGKYAPGKKVTLKATANKGYVFAGWVRGGRGATALPDDGGHAGRVTLPDDVISQAASLSFEMPSNDVEYVAMFVTAEEDKASIALAVDGEEMEAAGAGRPPYQTNVWAGVYLEWPVAASALSEPKVKVAGLPSGLKFTDKPVTSKIGSGKTAVVVTNVLANTIYGAPTAASKVTTDRKTGAVTITPSAVKVTVTTAGKSSQTYQIDTFVDALPAWAVGTFAGGGRGAPALPGQVSLTVSAAGKVSGKVLGDELTYTLAAPYYSGFELADGISNFVADVTASWSYKEGTKTVKTNDVVQVAVADNGIGGVATGGPSSVSAEAGDDGHAGRVTLPEWTAWQYNWKAEPWKTLGKSFDKKTLTYAILENGSFSEDEEVLTAALGADVPARVTLQFAASGAVSVAGEFAMYDENKAKYTTVKATGSATLVPVDDEHGEVFIYLTPKGLAPHARCVDVPWPEE